jgi:hypothetical protein
VSSVVYQPDYVPNNLNFGVLRASVVLRGHVVVYGFTVTNTNAAAQFLLMFDSATLPADGAVPLIGKSMSASDAVGFSWAPQGREFVSGLVLCNSSTQATKTIGAADCLFDVNWDLIGDADVRVSAEG